MDYGHDGVVAWAQDRTTRLERLILNVGHTYRKRAALLRAVLHVLLVDLGHAALNVVEMEYTLDNLPKSEDAP